MEAKIHFSRFGKKDALYIENLVLDDGIHLVAHQQIPPEYRKVWAKDAWIQQGIMNNGEVVCEVRKHHFYQEWFDIIELFDAQGALIGYHCDVVTPLRKIEGEYYLLDLLLDLWIFPDGRTVELDWDEFHAASQASLLAPDLQQKAVETMRWMVEQTRLARFPSAYLSPNPFPLPDP